MADFKAYIRNLKTQSERANIDCAAENSDSENFDVEENLPCTRLASSLYLWTKQGCVRHAKMLGTKMAWEVFTLLEKTYFGQIPLEQAAQGEETAAHPPQPYSNDNPPPFWELLKIIRDRFLIKFAEKILGEKLF